jgi:hypothetical protein
MMVPTRKMGTPSSLATPDFKLLFESAPGLYLVMTHREPVPAHRLLSG